MSRASRPKRRRKNDSRPQVETLISEEEENQPSDLAGTKRLKRAATLKRADVADIGPMSLAPVPKPIPAAMTGQCAIMGPEFFRMDALDLAPRLLGKLLRRDDVVLQITEVEAYRQNDTACHGRFGITPRTAPLFGPGGHAYVYMCYGLHVMLNVVADKEGIGAAVLIRSCSPVSGTSFPYWFGDHKRTSWSKDGKTHSPNWAWQDWSGTRAFNNMVKSSSVCSRWFGNS
ncbi:uncharacterized protein LOC116259332 isoform X2 [Nymphaea colorata]|uniref:uncharacterized protein LOC116259332 isoform X2 n=1 Tax=Nymphaea colorata TaxID=210225 RepID=UPI00214F4917|nr:uncharacterized protein LOC116259332 isoform X2 [Nymphaea colorata]